MDLMSMFLSFNEYARPRLYPNPNRAALATVLPLAMVLAVSACASPQGSLPTETDTASYGAYHQEAASPASTEVLGVIKDPETWALPFDPLFHSEMSRLQLYAHDLLMHQCMSNAGFDDYEILNDPTTPYPQTRPHGGGTLFNVTIAQAHGYRMAPDPSYKPSRDQMDLGGGSYHDTKPQSFRDQLDICYEEARLRLFEPVPSASLEPPPSMNVEDTFLSRLNRFVVDTSSPELQNAASQWRVCMAPQGITDLPEQPWGTAGDEPLPPSLQTRFDYWPTGTPSADEIAVATVDAQCRESSGWTHLLYEATWNQQAAFITAHQTDVDAYLAQIEQTTEEMRAIIAEAGGTL